MSAKPKQSPLIIVGGGFVAMAMALLCRHFGMPCQMVASRASVGKKRMVLSPSSMTLLQRLGCQHLCSHPLFSVDISIKGGLGHHAKQAYPIGHVVEAETLDQSLFAAVVEGKINVIQGRVVDVAKGGSKQVMLTVQHEDGHKSQLSTKHVLAADGQQSIVRQAMGIEIIQSAAVSAFSVDVACQYGHPHQACLRFADRTSMAWVPYHEQRGKCIILTEKKSFLAQKDSQTLLEQLEQELGSRCGHFTQLISQPYGVDLTPHRAKSLTAEGVTLLGNAACTLPPLGAQNLNQGLRDAAFLADALQQFSTVEESQQAYQGKRQQEHQWLSQLTDQGLSIMAGRTSFRKMLMAVGMALLGGIGERSLIRMGQNGFSPLPSMMRPRDIERENP